MFYKDNFFSPGLLCKISRLPFEFCLFKKLYNHRAKSKKCLIAYKGFTMSSTTLFTQWSWNNKCPLCKAIQICCLSVFELMMLNLAWLYVSYIASTSLESKGELKQAVFGVADIPRLVHTSYWNLMFCYYIVQHRESCHLGYPMTFRDLGQLCYTSKLTFHIFKGSNSK